MFIIPLGAHFRAFHLQSALAVESGGKSQRSTEKREKASKRLSGYDTVEQVPVHPGYLLPTLHKSIPFVSTSFSYQPLIVWSAHPCPISAQAYINQNAFCILSVFSQLVFTDRARGVAADSA